MVLAQTKNYVDDYWMRRLRRWKQEGTLGQKRLTTDLWLNPEQARELGFNQGEADYLLQASQIEGQYAKLPEPAFPQSTIQPTTTQPTMTAGANELLATLQRLYPERLAPLAVTDEDLLFKEYQRTGGQLDLPGWQLAGSPLRPEMAFDYLQDLTERATMPEAETILRGLGLSEQDLDQILGAQKREDELLVTLNTIPALRGYTLESLATLIETDLQGFVAKIQQGRITPDKKALLETMGFTSEDIAQIFPQEVKQPQIQAFGDWRTMKPPMITTPAGNKVAYQMTDAEWQSMTPAEKVFYEAKPQEWLKQRDDWAKVRVESDRVKIIIEALGYPTSLDTPAEQIQLYLVGFMEMLGFPGVLPKGAFGALYQFGKGQLPQSAKAVLTATEQILKRLGQVDIGALVKGSKGKVTKETAAKIQAIAKEPLPEAPKVEVKPPEAKAPEVIPTKPAEVAPEKEPWQMTREEFFASERQRRKRMYPKWTKRQIEEDIPLSTTSAGHRAVVRVAISEGKPVPAEVLKDYPDLKAIPKAEAVTPKVIQVPGEPEAIKPVYKTRVWVGKEQKPRDIPVQGKKIAIPGFEEFDLFIHKEVNPSVGELRFTNKYVVSEVSTGLKVTPQASKTQREAIALATETLNKRGIENVRKALANAEKLTLEVPTKVYPAIPTGAEAIKPSVAEAKQTEFVNEYVASKGQKLPPSKDIPVTDTLPPADMPASQQVASHISFDPEKESLVARFLSGKRKAMSQWVDKLYPIDTYVSEAKKLGATIPIEDNPYLLARLLEGNVSKATTFLEDGTFTRQFWKIEKGKAVPNFKGEGLSKILNEVKEPEAWRDFSTYLTALRAKELEALSIKSGITDDIATRAIAELETKYPKFSGLSDKIQKYQSELLDYIQESGLISADLRETLNSKYASYVPFYRVLEEIQGIGYMGKKMVDVASPIKRIKGSELEIINPLESIVKNTYAFINAADRNQVGVAMARLVHDIPELAGLFEPIKTPIAKVATVTAKELGIDVAGFSDDVIEGVFNIFRPSMLTKENVHTVMIAGKRQFFKVDPDLNVALSAMDTTNMGILWKVLSSPAKWLRAGATLSPDFMIRNPARDAMSAMVYSNYGFIPGVDFLRGVAHIIKKDATYRLYKMSGAEHSMLVSLDRDYLAKSFKEIVEGQKFTDYVRHPLRLLQIVSELGEKATRLGEFAKGIKSGDIPLSAGMSSREVTLDFAKAGTQAKAVNQIIAFFNANIRGWDRMVTGFKDHPIRTSTKVFAGITLPSIALWTVNHDDPRWKEIPQWQKDLFWVVMTDENIYRIPKPFELGVIFGSGPERLLDYLNEKDPKLVKQFAESFLQAGLPGWIPTGIEPIIENITNHSFFLDRPIVPESKQGLPPELQYTEYTSELAKAMGKLLKQSPMKIDNILYGWTAGLGRYATEGIDKILEKTGITPPEIKPSPTLADIPVVKAFVVRNPLGSSSESVNTFYEELESLTALEQLLKSYIADKKQIDFDKEKAKHPELLFTYDDKTDSYYSASARYLRRVAGELSDIRKLEDKIYKATNMTPEKKRELLTQLDSLITDMAVRALELIKNPSKETSLLQTPVSEIEAKIGTTSNSPLANDAVKLSDIAGDLIQGKGDSPLKKLLERNNKVLIDIANLPDESLYKIDRTSYKGGLTKRQNELLDQYEASTDKKQFLIDNPEIKKNPKKEWLTEHPEENAILALWGNSKLLTQKAYDIASKLVESNDIPDNALEDKVLPPKDLAKPYFEFQDILKDRDEASWEAKLLLVKNEKLREYLGYKKDDTPIASLELKVKNRANFDKLEGFSDEDSPDYIADEKKRAEAVKKFKADNPGFVDDTRRIEAIEKGTDENPIDEKLVNSHVGYGKLIDQKGIGSSSAETMLYRVDNPDYDQWRQDTGIWGDNVLKPLDQTKIPSWRIDVKYRKEDDEYDALPSTGTARDDYLADNDDYRKDRRRRQAYQKGLTAWVEDYVSYYELPVIGYRQERYLLSNPDFANALGLKIPERVPSEQWDILNEKTDRTPEDDLRMDAYKLYVPDERIEDYVGYKTLPAGTYEDDWFLQEHPEFYQEVYLGILGNQRKDYRKVPNRRVYAKYIIYDNIFGKVEKQNYRFHNRDLEDWLILTGKVKTRIEEERANAELTPYEKLQKRLGELPTLILK